MKSGAMVWLVKVIPRTHKMKGKETPRSCPVTSTYAMGQEHPTLHTRINK